MTQYNLAEYNLADVHGRIFRRPTMAEALRAAADWIGQYESSITVLGLNVEYGEEPRKSEEAVVTVFWEE